MSTMDKNKQHFQPRRFINRSAPLRMDSSRFVRAQLQIPTLPHDFFGLDYTRGCAAFTLEICIRSIHFSDSSGTSTPGLAGEGPVRLRRGNSLYALLARARGHRIMPAGREAAVPSALAGRTMPQSSDEVFERSTMTEHLPVEITVRESGSVSILDVRGRLTIGEPSDQLHQALESVVKGGARKVVVDLNGVPQIDSSGISSLVRSSIRLTREGGALRLICRPGRVRDALTVTRLIEAIPTFDSESAALANFA